MSKQEIAVQEYSKIIESNIIYAKKLAKKFYQARTFFNIDYEEYEAAAFLGLCSAAKRFDSSCGVDFKSYSYYRIVGAMCDLLRRGGFDYLGYSVITENKGEKIKEGEKRKLKKLYYRMPRDLKSLVSIVNSTDELGLKIHYLISHYNDYGVQISYAKQLDPETVAIKSSLKKYLRILLEKLPAKERQVLIEHYFQGKNFARIRKEKNNVSRSWISRLHKRALELLRKETELYQQSCEERLASYAC